MILLAEIVSRLLALAELELDRLVVFVADRADDSSSPSFSSTHVPAVDPLDLVGDGVELLPLGAVDDVGMLVRFIGRLVGTAMTSSL